MTERRSLLEGIEPKQAVTEANPDPAERTFVYGGETQQARDDTARVLVSTRLRGDYARALKRASLQRQLEGVTPNTLQDILEEAVRPWLKKHGFL